MDQEDFMKDNWKLRLLISGAVLGALTGIGAAYLMAQRAEKMGGKPKLSSKEGISLGLLLFGLLRQVSLLGGGDEK